MSQVHQLSAAGIYNIKGETGFNLQFTKSCYALQTADSKAACAYSMQAWELAVDKCLSVFKPAEAAEMLLAKTGNTKCAQEEKVQTMS